jgi:hypothetical protein
MGAPIVVGVLGAIGLSWLRRDSILWSVMFVSLAVALWGFAADRRRHRQSMPLIVGALGAVALVAGVVFIHGSPARLVIYAGALMLIGAIFQNRSARRAGAVEAIS